MHTYLHCPWISWLPQFHAFPGKEKEAEGKLFSNPNWGSQLSGDSREDTDHHLHLPFLCFKILSYHPGDIAKDGEEREWQGAKNRHCYDMHETQIWTANVFKSTGCEQNKTKTTSITIHITVWYSFFSTFSQLGILCLELYALLHIVVYVTSYCINNI